MKKPFFNGGCLLRYEMEYYLLILKMVKMKNVSTKNLIKVLTGSVLGLVILFSATVSFANSVADSSNIAKASVRYIGSTDDGSYFNVTFPNKSGEKFRVEVVDANGDLLYEGNFNSKSFDKKFLLPTSFDSNGLTFIVRSGNTSEKFNVSVKTNMVENVVVSKD